MKYSTGLFGIVFTLSLMACGGDPGTPASSSASSTTSSSSSSSSSGSSSSGLVVAPLGQLNCNESISENWPCSYNSSATEHRSCGYTSCSYFNVPSDYDLSVHGYLECSLSAPQYHPCGWSSDEASGGCGSGRCGSQSDSSSSSSGGLLNPSSVVINGDVEDGLAPWIAVGDAEIIQSDTSALLGAHSLYVYNRSQPSDGAGQAISGLKLGRIYKVQGGLSLESDSPDVDQVELNANFGPDDETQLLTVDINPGTWTRFSTFYKHTATSEQPDPLFYFRGPKAGSNIYVDAFSISETRRQSEIRAIAEGQANYVSEGCINCHGTGLGDLQAAVPLNPFNLQKTTRSDLARYIHLYMPEDSPMGCEFECAIGIAAYILSWE